MANETRKYDLDERLLGGSGQIHTRFRTQDGRVSKEASENKARTEVDQKGSACTVADCDRSAARRNRRADKDILREMLVVGCWMLGVETAPNKEPGRSSEAPPSSGITRTKGIPRT